ncbi:MAG: DUF362 domain-containing protein [Planctomycetota bacterium]|jgi:Pyruvate/2-oxoacid:ferredoxin oxidoreductase delta subunit
MAKPVVNKEECTACESCVDECPESAITMEDDIAVINYEKCNECGTCVETCPVEAITEAPE